MGRGCEARTGVRTPCLSRISDCIDDVACSLSVKKEHLHTGRSCEVCPLEQTPCSSGFCAASKMQNGVLK
jgi:hypothetical protein